MNESADESDLECLRSPVANEYVFCLSGTDDNITYQR